MGCHHGAARRRVIKFTHVGAHLTIDSKTMYSATVNRETRLYDRTSVRLFIAIRMAIDDQCRGTRTKKSPLEAGCQPVAFLLRLLSTPQHYH